jgi:hypothetical protein
VSDSASVERRSIDDEHTLYRRIPDWGNRDLLVQDAVTGVWRPSSGSLDFDPDASVYCREILLDHQLSWRSIVASPLSVVYAFTAREARVEFHDVEHTPYQQGYAEDQPHEIAHCSIWARHPETGEALPPGQLRKRAKRLASRARFVNFDPMVGKLLEMPNP